MRNHIERELMFVSENAKLANAHIGRFGARPHIFDDDSYGGRVPRFRKTNDLKVPGRLLKLDRMAGPIRELDANPSRRSQIRGPRMRHEINILAQNIRGR